MSKPVSITVGIIAIIVIIASVWWIVFGQSNGTPTDTGQPQSTATQNAAESEKDLPTSLVIFTDSGFEKQTYTIAAGETLTVRNDSSMTVEFSSDEHPTHRDNPELNMSALQPGEQGTLTPMNDGTWGIHDHEHPQFITKLVVTR